MPHKTLCDPPVLPETAIDSFSSTSHPNIHLAGDCSCVKPDHSSLGHYRRRQSQHNDLVRKAMVNELHRRTSDESVKSELNELTVDQLRAELDQSLPHVRHAHSNGFSVMHYEGMSATVPPRSIPGSAKTGSLAAALRGSIPEVVASTSANNDTPATTAPNSPFIRGDYFPSNTSEASAPLSIGMPMRTRSGTSGSSTPRVRPTTLDIPGLTKSKVSPDGRIAQRDVGSKLVIVMVGLPARGKSYITKKLARYLNWLQHDTRIFNVGERRRLVAGGPHSAEKTKTHKTSEDSVPIAQAKSNHTTPFAQVILNDEFQLDPPASPVTHPQSTADMEPASAKQEAMDQDAAFFDPDNKKASLIREQVARETLDELLDYILYGNGSVGILDATNSTMERRKMIMDHIRARGGTELNVLFLESRCVNRDLLEANMRLKLNGPDYKDMDPVVALADFRKRVQVYEKAYVPLGDYEEENNMPYITMIDVGRKIISHQIHGFLSAQANYYLLNFNLAPRQIWITRHGLSMDNISGKIGGDSDLAPEGHQYARSLTHFIGEKRTEWSLKQIENLKKTHFPPQPGDVTPPNPHYQPVSPGVERGQGIEHSADDLARIGYQPKSFCVWTSMMQRSIQTADHFNDEEYDIKQMRMLDELNAGVMEGLTYSCISAQYPEEFRSRKQDKLHYRYPGPGGEGYLDIINRLRPVIVELERMTDHVLLVGHRSVARVLLAYFRGLKREEVADLDVPVGMLYCLEPKPYGVDFKAYKWDKTSEWFYEQPDFQLKRAEDDMQ